MARGQDDSLDLSCTTLSFATPSRFIPALSGISPRAPHRSGLEPLDSSGSCHQLRAAALRQNRGLLLLPVDPLRFQRRWPARFAPRTLLRFPATTRQSAPRQRIRTLALVVHSTCGFFVYIVAKVLMFHTTAS